MTDGTLPFSHRYDKLDHAVFPTIRRRDKFGEVGDVNKIMVGEQGDREHWGNAEIIAKETVTLVGLNSQLFKFDTQSETFEDGMDVINSFYQDDIQPEEELTLYWNRWVNHGDSDE